MIKSLVATWLLKATMTWVPFLATSGYETKSACETRREQIAQDFHDVAFDTIEKPLFKAATEHEARAMTATFLASIASYESGFHYLVDIGRCDLLAKLNGVTEDKVCDNGKSHCIMQINIGSGKTSEGWSKADLIGDRKKCIRSALHILQYSKETCMAAGIKTVPDVFSIYAAGKCYNGSTHMLHRFNRASIWVRDNPVPFGVD